jgi:DNA-binding response OmpR family regulator
MCDPKAVIMVVDDDIDSLKLIGLMIQRIGYEVITANSGSMALAKAYKEQPDLIIMDVMMPDMDGYEVVKQLRAQVETTHIPVIMLTAKSLVDDKVKGFEAGADEYLTKPTSPPELASRLEAILARDQSQVQRKPEFLAQAETAAPQLALPTPDVKQSKIASVITGKILVMGNGEGVRLVSLMLTRQGFAVTQAASDTDVLEKLAIEKPNLVIVYHDAVDISRIELVESLIQLCSPITSIMVLGSEKQSLSLEESLDVETYDFVEIPIHPAELTKRVQALLLSNTNYVRTQFMEALQAADEQRKGAAVIELAEVIKAQEDLLPDTLAQDPFWHNVRHMTQGTADRADAERKWSRYAELAMALILPKPDQHERLLQLASEFAEADLKAQTLLSIGLTQPTRAFNVILEASYDEDKTIRRAAVESLGHLGTSQGISRLEECLSDSASAISLAAVQSLASIGTDDGIQILRKNLFEGSTILQSNIVVVLARLESETAANILIEAAQKDMHENVLYGITQALARMEAERAVPVLNNLMQHSSAHVREGARKALENIS